MLGIDTGAQIPDDHGPSSSKPNSTTDSAAQGRNLKLKRILTIVERAIFTMFSVAVSILVPEFSSMMAFLGSSMYYSEPMRRAGEGDCARTGCVMAVVHPLSCYTTSGLYFHKSLYCRTSLPIYAYKCCTLKVLC